VFLSSLHNVKILTFVLSSCFPHVLMLRKLIWFRPYFCMDALTDLQTETDKHGFLLYNKEKFMCNLLQCVCFYFKKRWKRIANMWRKTKVGRQYVILKIQICLRLQNISMRRIYNGDDKDYDNIIFSQFPHKVLPTDCVCHHNSVSTNDLCVN